MLSCGQKKTDNSSEQTTSEIDSVSLEDSNLKVKIDTIELPVVSNEGIEIVLPAGYRGYEPSDFYHMLSENWFDFYQDSVSKNHYLEKANITIDKFYDDCLQDSTTSVSSDRDCILLIKGLQFSNNQIKTIPVKKKYVWVGEKSSFEFNHEQYTLRGDGFTVKSDEPYSYLIDDPDELQDRDEVVNYKLYLSKKGVQEEQLLIAIPSFNHTFVKLLWVGDLDEDGKPDFIFDVSRDYEDKAVVLFLSSKAGKGEFVKCVGESAYSFDC